MDKDENGPKTPQRQTVALPITISSLSLRHGVYDYVRRQILTGPIRDQGKSWRREKERSLKVMRWTLTRLPGFWNLSARYSVPKAYRLKSTLTSNDHNIATILSKDPEEANTLQPTRVVGTIRTIRNQKRHSFVEIGDGSTPRSLQALLEPHQAEGGALVALTGHWQRSPPDKEQEKELRVEEVSVIGPTDAERYPLPKKIHGTDFLRTIPHLRLRTPLHALLARLRSECDYHLASYFRDHGFIRLQPPIITSSDCEGAGEVFTVSQNVAANNIDGKDDSPTQGAGHFFRESKYLTVSSQLHLEAYMSEHAKVWTLSPTFRAEKSDTSRHLSEFWMLEVEFRTESLSEVISQVEDMLKMLVKNLWTTCVVQEMLTLKRRDGIEDIEAGKEAASLISRRWAELAERPWPRITYSEAIDELEYAARSGTAQFQHRPSWCGGLQLEHERHIATTFGKGSPVFVTHYPQKIKPFYMLPTSTSSSYPSDQQATAACFDLLLPDGCEVVGGSLREHRLHHLSHAMRRIGLNAAEPKHDSSNADISPSTNSGNMEWYIDLRRYGSVPHGGFGLGFDRLLGYLAGIASIKDVVPWPRYFGRCDC